MVKFWLISKLNNLKTTEDAFFFFFFFFFFEQTSAFFRADFQQYKQTDFSKYLVLNNARNSVVNLILLFYHCYPSANIKKKSNPMEIDESDCTQIFSQLFPERAIENYNSRQYRHRRTEKIILFYDSVSLAKHIITDCFEILTSKDQKIKNEVLESVNKSTINLFQHLITIQRDFLDICKSNRNKQKKAQGGLQKGKNRQEFKKDFARRQEEKFVTYLNKKKILTASAFVRYFLKDVEKEKIVLPCKHDDDIKNNAKRFLEKLAQKNNQNLKQKYAEIIKTFS